MESFECQQTQTNRLVVSLFYFKREGGREGCAVHLLELLLDSWLFFAIMVVVFNKTMCSSNGVNWQVFFRTCVFGAGFDIFESLNK